MYNLRASTIKQRSQQQHLKKRKARQLLVESEKWKVTILKTVEELHRSEEETTESLIIDSRPESPSQDTLADEYQRKKNQRGHLETNDRRRVIEDEWTPTPADISEFEKRQKEKEEDEWTIFPREVTMEDLTIQQREDYFRIA